MYSKINIASLIAFLLVWVSMIFGFPLGWIPFLSDIQLENEIEILGLVTLAGLLSLAILTKKPAGQEGSLSMLEQCDPEGIVSREFAKFMSLTNPEQVQVLQKMSDLQRSHLLGMLRN